MTNARHVRRLARSLGCKLRKVPAREMPARAGDYRLIDDQGATIEAPLAEIETILTDLIEVETSDSPLTPRDEWVSLNDPDLKLS